MFDYHRSSKMAEKDRFTLKQIGNYKFVGESLGKGNFARVELAEHRLTGAKVSRLFRQVNP